MRIAATKAKHRQDHADEDGRRREARGEQNRLAAATKFGSWTSVLEEEVDLRGPRGRVLLPDHSAAALTPDKGLCGGVHSAVARGIRGLTAKLSAENKTISVLAVGEKGRSQLRRMVGDSLSMAVADIPPHNFNYASMVAETALELDADKAGAIQVVYNEFVSAIAYNPTIKSIEPFVYEGDDVTLTNYDAEDTVLKGLYEYYVATEIFYGMMQGATSEQSSRMQAMENATKNGGELIDKLVLIYNRARQARITTELIEIISGAAALE
ncbi:proton-transporting ATP synthase [Aureococcus anophagefferens]|nr:proton-transporting ATP synthase [Aureococcus anophagefferens]